MTRLSARAVVAFEGHDARSARQNPASLCLVRKEPSSSSDWLRTAYGNFLYFQWGSSASVALTITSFTLGTQIYMLYCMYSTLFLTLVRELLHTYIHT